MPLPAQIPGQSFSAPGSAAPPAPADRGYDRETTRLLGAGTYLSAWYRRQVVDLLVKNDDRALAAPAGIDLLTVLAHALRAGKLQRRTGNQLLRLWALFAVTDLFLTDDPVGCAASGEDADDGFLGAVKSALVLPYDLLPSGSGCTGFWVGNYAIICLLVWLARKASRRCKSVYDTVLPADRRRITFLSLINALEPGLLGSYWLTAVVAVGRDPAQWAAVVFPLLLTVPVWRHRRAVEHTLHDQFRSEVFDQRPSPVPTRPASLRRVVEVIRREQDSRLVLYDKDRGLAGIGRAVLEPMPIVMDLKPVRDSDPVPPTSAEVLAGVRRGLEQLQGAGGSPGADRLRGTQIDEVICLPAGPPRDTVDHGQAAVERHLEEAVEEGGEGRRHYLRARIGAWEQQIVVTALLRVCIKGTSLTLDVSLYVMDPLRPEFEHIDAIAEQGPDLPASSITRALQTAPGAGVAAVLASLGGAGEMGFSLWRRLQGRTPLGDPSLGASSSVRQLAASYNDSPLLETDVNRYQLALMERIRTGTVGVLREKGFETGQLEEVMQVNNNGIYIGTMVGGAVAAGRGARARTGARQPTRGRATRQRRA